MIINGGSRAAAKWLGNHLARTDHNERVEVLELQTLHDDALPVRDRLIETFRDWQVLAGGTQGENGLYHANIDPAKGYTMTAAQWARAVEVLEEELRLDGQPRAVVLHEKHGRAHLHVVWQRTDIETMTLRDDSFNYRANMRASLRLEQEFGHEIVPGKHEKRDRERQPEPPKAALDHAEWQQAERTGIDPRTQKETIAALHAGSDSGQAFRAALEDSGYVLARGDRDSFVAIDAIGEVHSIGRAVKMRAPALRAFMADIDSGSLPNVEEARAQQAARAVEQEPPRQQEEAKTPEPAHAEPELEPLARSSRVERVARIMAIREATLERQAQERAAQDARHVNEIKLREDLQAAEARSVFDDLARKETKAIDAARAAPLNPVQQLWQSLRETLSPQARDDRLTAERQCIADAELQAETAARLAAAALDSKHRAELAALAAQQGQERADLIRIERQELARRIWDERRAQALEWAYVQRERERQAAQPLDREGPERLPPR